MLYCQVSQNGQIGSPQLLPRTFENVSNFHTLDPEMLPSYGFYPFAGSHPPNYNPATQRLEQHLQLSGQMVIETWTVIDLTPEEQMSYLRSQKAMLKQLLDQHMNQQVAPRDFDTIQTAITWADSSNPTWAADGQAAKAFRQACFEAAYKIENEVLAGVRPVPTPEQFASEMPVLWAPPSPSSANGTLS